MLAWLNASVTLYVVLPWPSSEASYLRNTVVMSFATVLVTGDVETSSRFTTFGSGKTDSRFHRSMFHNWPDWTVIRFRKSVMVSEPESGCCASHPAVMPGAGFSQRRPRAMAWLMASLKPQVVKIAAKSVPSVLVPCPATAQPSTAGTGSFHFL